MSNRIQNGIAILVFVLVLLLIYTRLDSAINGCLGTCYEPNNHPSLTGE